MTKEKFTQIVKDGVSRNKEFIVVKLETEGNTAHEIIINPKENFVPKIKYYLDEYDDNLELIRAKKNGKIIKITDVLMTSNLNDLSWFAY